MLARDNIQVGEVECWNAERQTSRTESVCLVQYGVKISLITSFKDTCFIEIVPTEQKSKRGLYLCLLPLVYSLKIYHVCSLWLMKLQILLMSIVNLKHHWEWTWMKHVFSLTASILWIPTWSWLMICICVLKRSAAFLFGGPIDVAPTSFSDSLSWKYLQKCISASGQRSTTTQSTL